MTEAERQAILSSAKTFFRTRIAENHKANTEKLTSLSKFNINPFTHKYLAQFAFGDSSPESMAKALIYPRVLGTSISTTFGTQLQYFCNEVLSSYASTTSGIDIEFIDALAIHSSSRVFQSSNIPFLRLLTVRRRKMRIVGKYRFQQLVAECFCASVIEKQLRNDGLSVPLCCDDTIRLLLRGGCGFLFCHWVTPSFGCKKRISHSWKIPFCCRLFCFTIRAAQRLAPFALPDIPAP